MTISSLADLKNYIQKEILPFAKVQTVILLSGDLGAGKTQFVKTFCELSGVKETVSSPTFSIIQEYPWKAGTIYHVDLYRMESPREVENTGFWEIFENTKALVFIEWPEKMDLARIPSHWHKSHVKIKLYPNHRQIETIYESNTHRKN